MGLALLATECSENDQSVNAQEGSPSSSQSPTLSLPTPKDVKNRLMEAGLACNGDEIKSHENSETLKCTDDVLISVYSSKDQARIATDFHAGEGKSVITDEDWVLLSDNAEKPRPYAEKLDLKIHKS